MWITSEAKIFKNSKLGPKNWRIIISTTQKLTCLHIAKSKKNQLNKCDISQNLFGLILYGNIFFFWNHILLTIIACVHKLLEILNFYLYFIFGLIFVKRIVFCQSSLFCSSIDIWWVRYLVEIPMGIIIIILIINEFEILTISLCGKK